MREAELDTAAIDYAGIRGGDTEALENALRILAERVMAGLQPDGSPNRDLKPDVGLIKDDGTGGRTEAGCIAEVFDCDASLGAAQAAVWASAGRSGDLHSGSGFLVMAMKPDATHLVTIQAIPFETDKERRRKWSVGSNGVINSSPVTDVDVIVGVGNRADLGEIPAMNPDSGHMIYKTDVAKDLRVIALSSLSKVDDLTTSVSLASTGPKAMPFWDPADDRLYWPQLGNGGPVVIDASDPTALVELGVPTLSAAKNLRMFVLSPDGTHLYGIGDTVIVVYSISAGSPFLTEVQIFSIGAFLPEVAAVAASGSLFVTEVDPTIDWRTYDINSSTQLLTFNSTATLAVSVSSGKASAHVAVIDDRIAFRRSVSAGGTAWLIAIDIADPTGPVLQQEIELGQAGDTTIQEATDGSDYWIAPALGMDVEAFIAAVVTAVTGTKITAGELEATRDVIAGRDVISGRDVTAVRDVIATGQLKSLEATDPPLVVANSALVAKLNADLLDDLEGVEYAKAPVGVWLWDY